MKKVVVIGSLNIDLVAKVPHAPAAGETVNAEKFYVVPGGKGANQAVGMARLGLRVTLVGRVGKDHFGDFLIQELEKENLNTSCIFRDDEAMTSIAMIILDEKGENRIVVGQEANYRISISDIDRAKGEIEKADFIVCHFGQPHPVLPYVLRQAKNMAKRILLNPAPAFALTDEILKSVDYLIVNQGEAEIISGSRVTDVESACRIATQLQKMGPDEVVITLGAHGSVSSKSNCQLHLPGYPVPVADTTAAGDAFIAGFVYGVLNDWAPELKIQFANACGALASTKIGAISSLPRKEEIELFLESRKEAEENPKYSRDN